ncbi:MAG TPA: hypothetical protein VE685_15450 [Thermoanaerobaculia bacterium]|nr:hypothetical protein [Thermoanaerobaculia bacterium]
MAKDLPILEDEEISREQLLHRRQDIPSPGAIAGFQHPLHLAEHRIADEALLSSIRRLLEEPLRESRLTEVVPHQEATRMFVSRAITAERLP